MPQQIKLETKKQSKVLEGLNPEQVEAVRHGEGPLLIVAGAGTGKTTVITRRVAYLIEQGVAPEEILAVTFTEKAAEEMEERIDQLLPLGYVNVNVSTFHAFGEQILREYGLEIGLPDFEVLDEVGQWLLIRDHLDKFELKHYKPLGSPTRFIKALVSHFSRAKDELVDPDEYLGYAEEQKLDKDLGESGLEEGQRVSEVANAFQVYQRLLLENSYLDFGDLINYPLLLFKKRPQVLKQLQEQYKYILVDEFQDTNLAQYELVKLLAKSKDNITVVGDDDQSIFKFRGASISNIMHFKGDYPDAKFTSLIQNYRNGQKILDKSHKFISQNNPDRLEVKLGISKKLQANQKKPGEIEQLVASDYLSEAELVVEKILELANQYPELTWNDFAILSRSHSIFEAFIAKLEEKNIPYIYAGSQGLYKKPIILNLLSYFRLLDDYHENETLYRVLKLPVLQIPPESLVEITHFAKRKGLSLYQALKQASAIKGLDEAALNGVNKLLRFIQRHTQLAKEKSVNEVYREVFNDLRLSSQVRDDYHAQRHIEVFTKKVMGFQLTSGNASLRAFMDQIDFEKEAGSTGDLEFDPEAGPEAVRLLTVHSAKGLEFRNVFIVGLVDKRFPSISRREPIELPDELVKEIIPEGDIHLQEERRLFYVAMTRAKFNLYLTRAYDYGGKRTKKPSRFLVELGLAEEEKSKPTGKVEFQPEKQGLAYPRPQAFSFTQISVFKKCPLEYKYRYLLKIPPRGTPHLSFGLAIHRTLEKFMRLFKQQQTGQDLFGASAKTAQLPDFPKLVEFYEQEWIDDWYGSKAEQAKFKQTGLEILKYFYKETENNLPTLKALEKLFKTKIGQYDFVGKIDRVDETAEGLRVIDYKTGKPRDLGPVDKDQLVLYQKAASEMFEQKVGQLEYWYLRDGVEKKSFSGTERDFADLEKKLTETVEQILECIKHDSFLEFDRRTSHRKECEYREFEV